MPVTELILASSPLATAAPVVIALSSYNRYPVLLRTFSLLLFIAGFIQLTAWLLWMNRSNNLYLLHIYTISEFILLTIVYKKLLSDLLKPWFFLILTSVFLSFAIADAFFLNGVMRYNTFSRPAEAFIILIYSILYFVQLLRSLQVQRLESEPFFWINSAILLYFSSSLFLFILSNSILGVSLAMNKIIWSLHAILAWIMYTTVSIGLWKARRI